MEKDPFTILKYPLSTEKCIRMMEAENKIVFIVDVKATKKEIQDAANVVLKARVIAVNTSITPKGLKKAYLKFAPDVLAMDIATNLGLI